MLPNGWSIKTIGDLFDVQLGKMLNQEAKEKQPQYKYLGNSNVQWAKFNLSDLKSMHFNQSEQKKFKLEKNDILLCEGGEVGRCAIWDKEESTFYQKALHRLRSKGCIEPIFFQNFMVKIAGTKLLDDYTTKTSIAHLTQEKLIQLPIKLPPLSEQKKIAQILSTWDNAIATTEKLLENSKKQKYALMQQLLTGKKRFPSFKGGWATSKVQNLVTISKGEQLNRDGLIESDIYPVINGGISPSGYTDKANNKANTITISEGGNSCGYVALQSSDFWCGGHCYALKTPKLPLLFLYQLLKFNERKIMRLRVGSGLPNIQKKDLDALHLTYPVDTEEQMKIAAVLSTADEKIKSLEKKLDFLKEEKKALMQQLLTGKRTVKVDL